MTRRLIYIHVPKCGGSSFGAALRLRFAWSQAAIAPQGTGARLGETPSERADRIAADYAARGGALRQLVERGTRCIAAHVRYDPALHDGAARGYAHVTLLRDPVDRFVSHYRYLQRRHPDPARPDTLAGFLDTPDATRIARQYLFYFGGDSGSVTEAARNLSRFDLVGTLDDTGGFARDLGRLAGLPLPVLSRNRAPSPTQVPDELRARIETLCADDRAIYRARILTGVA